MNNNNQKYTVLFCGISKNCIETIGYNLAFLSDYRNESKFQIKMIFIDSDSNDGTKKELERFSIDKNFVTYVELNGLEAKYKNRIERIALSRNACLNIITKNYNLNNVIYIPLDLDINLFKFATIDQLDNLINYCIEKKEPNGIFPFSEPFYYDIFALRASGWVRYNSQFWAKRMKKYIKIGSFIYNYFLIFRHQVDLVNFKKLNINISSAFGGIGIYKLPINFLKYTVDKNYPEDVSEHVLFNSQFDELEIMEDWKIPAPAEHLEYRLLNWKMKISYILKTLKNDLKQNN